MPTDPMIVERDAQPYVAIRERVSIPFGPVVERVMPEVAGWLQARGVQRFGPALFRYNLIRMPDLEVELGFAPPEPVAGEGRIGAGVLPAGRYATLTHVGPYDGLLDATGSLIGWAKQTGLRWDSTEGADGERFASRFELYPNGPVDEPDPQKWETQIFIKLAD